MYKFFNARRVTLDELAGNLRGFLEESNLPLRFIVRTVAVRADGEWHHFATVAVPSSDKVRSDSEGFDDVRLIASCFDVNSAMRSADDLRDCLAAWRKSLDVSSGYPFQNSFNSTYQGSGNEWGDPPAWELRLHETLPRDRSYGLPNGPFLSERLGLFATSVGQLAAKWVGDDAVAQQNSTDTTYKIILPDNRLWIKSIGYARKILNLDLDGTYAPDGASCVIRVMDRQKEEHELIHTVTAHSVEIELPVEPIALDLWLLVGGEVLDRFQETEHSHSRRTPVLRTSLMAETAGESDLRSALDSGENDTTEFKAWLDVQNANSKLAELAQSIVAFANRSGGRIFIGVNDNAEPIGVDKPLRDIYGPLIKKPLAELRDVYVDDLRRYINQEVDPTVALQFTWIEFAKRHVLRISVPDVSATMHSVVGTSEVFVRRGATNRKIKHADLPNFWSPVGISPG